VGTFVHGSRPLHDVQRRISGPPHAHAGTAAPTRPLSPGLSGICVNASTPKSTARIAAETRHPGPLCRSRNAADPVAFCHRDASISVVVVDARTFVRIDTDRVIKCGCSVQIDGSRVRPGRSTRQLAYPRWRILWRASRAVSSASGSVCRYFSVVRKLPCPRRSLTI